MPRLQYTKGVAGSLVLYAPEGIPDADATLTIYTSGNSTLAGSSWPVTVSLSTATTTLSALAAQYAESLALTDATNFAAGERYYINDGGQLLEVKASRKSSNTLYLDQPLSFGVASGATIASHKLAFALSTTHTATLRRRLRAVWSYEVDGVAYSHQQYFSVVNEPFELAITEEDIEGHDLAFGEYTDDRGAWRKLIDGAHDEVERMLRARQLSPDLIRDRDGLRDALIFCLLGKWYMGAPGQRERAEMWQTKAERAIAQVIEARGWYDVDDDHQGGSETGQMIYDAAGAELGVVGADGVLTNQANELGLPVSYARVG